jgi:alpha/beta superfamily hydrolase
MLNSYIPKKFFIDGPAGKLETVLAEFNSKHRHGIAVIAHPHPLYGGTMDNKVVHTIFKALFELGFITVKFNYRGVGKSEGVYGDGVGEIEDVVTVVEAFQNQFDAQINNLSLLLAGFSFGGAVQAHVAKKLGPQSLVMVAPSVDHLKVPSISSHVKRTLIIQGDQDEIVPLKTILDWAAPQDLPVVVIPGAEHFFHGKLHILKQTVLDWCRL